MCPYLDVVAFCVQPIVRNVDVSSYSENPLFWCYSERFFVLLKVCDNILVDRIPVKHKHTDMGYLLESYI